MEVGVGTRGSRGSRLLGQYSERQSVVGEASVVGVKDSKEKSVNNIQKRILRDLE